MRHYESGYEQWFGWERNHQLGEARFFPLGAAQVQTFSRGNGFHEFREEVDFDPVPLASAEVIDSEVNALVPSPEDMRRQLARLARVRERMRAVREYEARPTIEQEAEPVAAFVHIKGYDSPLVPEPPPAPIQHVAEPIVPWRSVQLPPHSVPNGEVLNKTHRCMKCGRYFTGGLGAVCLGWG